MSDPLKIVTVVGTRPELIKLSSTIRELDASTNHVLVHTGQNWDERLRDVFFADLGIRPPDRVLDVAAPTVAAAIANVMTQVDGVLEQERPDAFLVYGDTNSCLSVLCAKRRRIPVFHMEAGNRSFDERVPEEINRRVIDHVSDVNFTNSAHAREYLLREGLRPELVINAGSPMREVLESASGRIAASTALADQGVEPQGYFVLSSHREENVDDPQNLAHLLAQIDRLVEEFGWPVIISTHPRTRQRLGNSGVATSPLVHWCRPFNFSDYVALQRQAACVLSDSGSLTEEAAIMGFPAVMLREAHERPEGMEVGAVPYAGLSDPRLVDMVRMVIRQHDERGPCEDIPDYGHRDVASTVVRAIMSMTPYVRRVIWQGTGGSTRRDGG